MHSPLLPPDEIEMVKQFLIYPYLLEFLEQDFQTIRDSELLLSFVINADLKKAHHHILDEIVRLKKELSEREIKVTEQERTDRGIDAQYICRGYEYEMRLLWGFVRAELTIKLSQFFNVDLTKIES